MGRRSTASKGTGESNVGAKSVAGCRRRTWSTVSERQDVTEEQVVQSSVALRKRTRVAAKRSTLESGPLGDDVSPGSVKLVQHGLLSGATMDKRSGVTAGFLGGTVASARARPVPANAITILRPLTTTGMALVAAPSCIPIVETYYVASN